jgi:hypothetical protein
MLGGLPAMSSNAPGLRSVAALGLALIVHYCLVSLVATRVGRLGALIPCLSFAPTEKPQRGKIFMTGLARTCELRNELN